MGIPELIARSLADVGKIAVWGGGGLGRLALSQWLPAGKVAYVVDSNPTNHGKNIAGKPVFGPERLAEDPPEMVVICSTAYLEIWEELERLGHGGRAVFIYQLFLPPGQNVRQLDCLKIDLVATKNDNYFWLLLKKPQVMVNITYRLARHFRDESRWRLLYWPLAVLHYVACLQTSIQLPLETEIGPGLVFAHPGTIVFTGRARLGAFVTVYHNCTIGTNDSGHAPVIGDFVTIFANSLVLGGSRIASHSRIGALSLALDLVTEQPSTIVGVPAKMRRIFRFPTIPA